MTLPLPTKDQEPCCVYPAPVKLLPFSCSKTHGSGNSELSTAKDEALATGQAKPPHCHYPVRPKRAGAVRVRWQRPWQRPGTG